MLVHGADKASFHNAGGHSYADHYEMFFERLREQPIKLLEIGIGSGPSVQAWLSYFDRGFVFGVDKVAKTNDWNTPGNMIHPRYSFNEANQSDETFWKCLFADCPSGIDILIDDSSHMADDVVNGFKYAWPLVRSGGYYCIEDLSVGGTPGSVFLKPGYPTHMQFVHSLMERADVDSFYFAGELLILRKK